jgi:hypothetical protein
VAPTDGDGEHWPEERGRNAVPVHLRSRTSGRVEENLRKLFAVLGDPPTLVAGAAERKEFAARTVLHQQRRLQPYVMDPKTSADVIGSVQFRRTRSRI